MESPAEPFPEELVRVGRVLALALARAVVGVVEALPLEVHRGRVQHALDLHPGLGVVGQRVVAEGLLNFERRPVGAPVLVDGHRA